MNLKRRPKRGQHHPALAFSFLLILLGPVVCGAHEQVLVFSKTTEFRHPSITNGQAMILQLGATNDFDVDLTEDASVFTFNNLTQYQAVVWLNTTGDVLDPNQQAAFEDYIRAGGGYVGIHAASDTEYAWPWYGQLVGSFFSNHPAPMTATVKVADPVHPSTATLPRRWSRADEWYNFQANPRGTVHVLATVDEATYAPGIGAMGFDHPIAWCHNFDGGRAWYTALGHTPESYSETNFRNHVLGGILWATGRLPGDAGATIDSNFQKVILDAAPNNPMELAIARDGRVFIAERGGALKIWKPQSASVTLAGQLSVFTQLEDGLLGVALDPGFATNNWVYLYYSPVGAAPIQLLSRFTMSGDTLNLASEVVLLVVPTQRDECCHSGGSLAFGPDRTLYLAIGDNTNPFDSSGFAPMDERPGRSAWDAQKSSSNPNDLRGKILRIHPETNGTYTIPAGNLFPPGTPGTRPEIYVMGNRNPFRIAVDQATGWLYWGEVGPDASSTNATRGPAGHDEWNQARTAGNYGWPYFVGSNYAYADYNFATDIAGDFFNPATPVNNSPNNTGITNLPPARPAWIWTDRSGTTPQFPEILAGTGRCALGGPVYRYDPALISSRKLPSYYDGTAFIMDWARNYLWEVKMDEAGDVLKINRFLPTFAFKRPHEMEIGPDGAIYMIEWGTGFSGNNADARVIRVDYTGGNNRAPVAVGSATPASGLAPLTVQFSSAGTYDPDPDGPLTYVWSFFGDGVASVTTPNPVFTFTNAGNYPVQLRVTDSFSNSGVANIDVTVGNRPPTVQINWPPDGGVFDWSKAFSFRGQVADPEDGSTTNGTIACAGLGWDLNIGHNDHSHNDSQAAGCSGFFEAPDTHGGDGENVFLVVRAHYSDLGAPPAGSLTGEAVSILQPRRKQVEFFTSQSGATVYITGDNNGASDVTGLDHGDSMSFFPVNLTNITSLKFRVAAAVAGGQIQLRKDSPAGILLGTVAVPDSANAYTNVTAAITDPGGAFELFLVFTRNPGDADLMRVNWFEFVGAGVALDQAPFHGTNAIVPGRIQAEDFDLGGEAFAYHDNEAANQGNVYRNTGVDIQATSDTDGGYNIGWGRAGEWLEYTVNVSTPGVYRLDVRTAYDTSTNSNGGSFHVEVDGTNITGAMTIPGTGDWQNWRTLTRSNLSLAAGPHVIRLALDAEVVGNVGNFNWLEFALVNAPPASLAPVQLTAVVVGNQLRLSWPADHTGWRLEQQTNSLATGLGTNWFTVAGSQGTNAVSMLLYPAQGSVFLRLIYP